MSTNTKLAEALRRLIGASMVAMTDQELATGETLSAWEDANEALAAHDAEQAQEQVGEVGRMPAAMQVPTDDPTALDYAAGSERGYAQGWNACRAAMLAAAPTPPAPEAPPDTEAVTACWQDFGRTDEFRRAAKWSQDGEIPGALFVAFRAGLRAASPKALCDCGKKPAAECDKWEPGCDLGRSPEHARVVRLDKAQAAPEAQPRVSAREVYAAMSMQAHARTSSENVQDVLDALDALAATPAPEAQQAAGHASVEDWERELSAVMPKDFKDWWQNSRTEWPAVAAEVIRNQRADRDLGWEMAALAQQADDWQHLKPYGYAPGNYMSRCLVCGKTPVMDKRAVRCRPCAEAAHANDTPAPAQQAAGQELPPLPRAASFDDHRTVPTAGKYTADQMHAYARAALAQRREPMTASQVNELCDECNLDWHRGWALDEEPNRYLELARAIEKHHGIGATTGEQR